MMVVLVGPPGAGKSSQSALLKKREHIEWVSVGQLLRDINNPVIDEIMDRGDLVKDEFVNQTLANYINKIDNDKVVVIDGYPRRKPQAEWLVDYANQINRSIKLVIKLEVPREVSKARLIGRGRSDDTDESIQGRLEDYYTNIEPLVDVFIDENVPLKIISGDRPIEEVFKEMDKAILDVHQSKN